MGLTVDRVSQSFALADGRKHEVLRDISFEVPEGGIISLIGPSGCGKTTLLRILAGLQKASQGQVLLDGQPVTKPSGKLGLVFQEYALFPWRTTLRNVEMGLELKGVPSQTRREMALSYLAAFGLEAFADHYPRALSGGMQQRVAIARTLIMEPRVVLMDEPFGSLDSQTRNDMQEFLLTVWEKRRDSIVFVTHNVEEAVFLSDEILVFSRNPARILAHFSLSHAGPRDRLDPECVRVRGEILQLIRQVKDQSPHGRQSRTRTKAAGLTAAQVWPSQERG
ncbi:MAG: ABC transporter ATP-binding protein [Deltaproteobacteria bacterium]|nr:ABC transporter ATP-binding protein [Deltaproteobacteria bacterium]